MKSKKILVALLSVLTLGLCAAGASLKKADAKAADPFIRVDTCDAAWGLNPVQKDELGRTYWEGQGAVRTYGAKYVSNCFISLEKTLNLTSTGLNEETAALGMWLYVNDVNHITGDASIEIASGGACDKGEYGWGMSKLIEDKSLRSGWNWLELKIKDAGRTENGVTPNIGSINFIRVYAHGTNVAMMIDDIILYDSSSYDPKTDLAYTRVLPTAANTPSEVVLESCDSSIGVTDTLNKTEGGGSASVSGSGMLIIDKVLSAPVNVKSDVYRAELAFDLYVDDVSKLDVSTSGYNVIEVSSSGKCDVDEYEFDLTSLVVAGKIKTGWNSLRLPFACTQLFKADNDMISKSLGSPDMTKLNYVRLLTNGSQRTVKIDNIRVADRDYTAGSLPPPTPPAVETGDFVRISDGDSAWGLNPSQGMKYGATYWQGTGAVRSYTGKNGYNNVLEMATTYSVGVSNYAEENASIGLWLYINDVDSLVKTESAMIEISSSGTFDQDEYEWSIHALKESGTVTSGWNWLELGVKDAVKTGLPDLNALNYIRVYMHGTNLLVFVDDVILFDAEVYVPTEDEAFVRTLPLSENAADYTVLSDCESSWEGGETDKENVKHGKTSVSATGSGELLLSTTLAPVNTGLTIYEAVLDFWFYTDNVEAMTKWTGDVYNAIEISSSGRCDADEIELNLTTMMLDGRIVNGWNHLSIPLSAALAWQSDNDMINKTVGSPDISKINYIRLLTRGSERTVKIDFVSVRKASYSGEILMPITGVLLDGGEAQTGWKVDRLEYRYANYSVKAEGAEVVYVKTGLSVGETDLTGKFGVSFWGYVGDSALLDKWSVTIKDENGKSASWTGSSLQSGWNWLVCTYADATVEEGFDADKVDAFEMKITYTSSALTRLSRISLIDSTLSLNVSEPVDKVLPPEVEEGGGNSYDVKVKDAEKKDKGIVTVLAVVGGVALLAAAAYLILVIKKKN